MLVTRKSSSTARHGDPAAATSALVHSLRRGLANAMPTMDRRAFLRRSGLGVGVGLAAASSR
jgi:formate dehydrogenase major subunit